MLQAKQGLQHATADARFIAAEYRRSVKEENMNRLQLIAGLLFSWSCILGCGEASPSAPRTVSSFDDETAKTVDSALMMQLQTQFLTPPDVFEFESIK